MSSSQSSDQGPFVRALLPRPPSALVGTRPRLVLLQHTLRLPDRLVASSPAAAAAAGSEPSGGAGSKSRRRKLGTTSTTAAKELQDQARPTGEDELYRLAGLRTPTECAERDGAGGLFVLTALGTLAGRTGGRVVWVKVADNLSLPPEEEEEWVRTFRKSGAVVDLASDALGWDDGDDDDYSDNGARVHFSRMDNLESVASAVERAAAEVASGLGLTANANREDGPDLVDEGTTSDDGDAPTDGRMAVPIVFDSVNPLLTMHGMGPTMRLLRRLAAGGVGGSDKDSSSRQCLSPIVVPVLTEAVRPSDLRRFEDEADGILTLSGGEMNTVRRGGGGGKGGAAGRLVNDVQPFRMESSSSGGIRRRAGGAATKLILGPVVGGGNLLEAPTPVKSVADDNTESLPSSARMAQTSSPHRTKPTLRHEEGGREEPRPSSSSPSPSPSSSTQRKAGAPRIYVQDDDPEFDDLDEEDLDDDLDL